MSLNPTRIHQLSPGDIALVGLPYDENSSFLKGPALAPQLIVDAINSDSANFYTESLIQIADIPHLKWCGETSLSDYWAIEKTIDSILAKGAIPFSLGGDHSITYPIVKAMAKKYAQLSILHFDAHGDLYDVLDGNKLSHACPFARIMESQYAQQLTQIGIRTMTQHQKEQADRFGVTVNTMKDRHQLKGLNLEGPVYLSFDLDVLDPAYAPGVSHHEPGGYSTREVLDIIQSLELEIVGLDVVEYNPKRDLNGVTGMVAAKIIKELIEKVL
ncbi:agmatinase [Roseivirga sp. UBA838]|uniref:agmatinase n=1 Tax=Roseivirga sp. UBA838 TaxID=1947393 RepID=UPI00257E4A5C|nr:agmatinase [Roseivirga sp. UBA838]|tara:strand:+ start:860 stop:1675 length:816 start_codon:yes stop_codon:yes gene_type:complete